MAVVKKIKVNGTAHQIGADAENVSYGNTNVKAVLDNLDGSSELAGKSFAVLGDSFTALGAGTDGWFDVMCAKLGAVKLANRAGSGARWSGSTGSATSQANALVSQLGATNPNYIIAVFGVNDINNDQSFSPYTNEVTLGDISYNGTFDLTGEPHSVTAGLQSAITTLKRNFPNSIIKIGWTPSGIQQISTYLATHWSVFKSYTDRIKDVCAMYGVDYIDTLACGCSPYISEDVTNYMNGANDHHPNPAGRQRIGEYMARIMLSNL